MPNSIKADPEITRAWQQRSREKAAANAKPRAPLKRTATPAQRAAIRKVSAKRKAQNVTYSKRVAQFKRDNPLCARCKAAGRETPTCDNHHMRGKEGERLNDVAFWLPLCRPCHNWATDHPIEAKAAGWSVSRIGIVQGGADE
jgi:hypothetical protein